MDHHRTLASGAYDNYPKTNRIVVHDDDEPIFHDYNLGFRVLIVVRGKHGTLIIREKR